MGKLLYGGSGIEIEFDDRALTHLQVVISAKLRRHESFFFSWHDGAGHGNGRSGVWMDRSIPLYFKYYGGKAPTLNASWVTALMTSANSGQGLVYSDEPGAAIAHPR